MSGLKIDIDAAGIASQFKELALEVEQDIRKGVANLAAVTHAYVAEQASAELKTSRKTLIDNLGFEEVTDGIWVVSIDEKAFWLEEGIEPGHDMKPDLLKNNTKTSAKGHHYKSIPFDQGKAPSQLSPPGQYLLSLLKRRLKEAKIPFKKIEKNPDGSPRLGKLHSKNFDSPIPSRRGNTPALHGVTVYQTMTKTGNVRRDIMTFRTVSDGPASEGKWIHPGLKPKHYLERAMEWGVRQWEEQILPEILKKYE